MLGAAYKEKYLAEELRFINEVSVHIWRENVTGETNEAILKSKYDLSAWSFSLTDLEGRTGTLQVIMIHSVQFSSVAQSCPTLCNPMNCSMPGLPAQHQLLEFTQTHVDHVVDAIQPSHLLSSPSLPAPNPSQHQSLFQGVNSLHEVA